MDASSTTAPLFASPKREIPRSPAVLALDERANGAGGEISIKVPRGVPEAAANEDPQNIYTLDIE